MKNLYFIIIALAFFSDATAQFTPTQSKLNHDLTPNVGVISDNNNSKSGDITNQSGYTDIILKGYHILWVFNDVGNRSTNRNGISNNAIPEIETSNSSVVETSVYPVPAKDHLNFTFSTDINSGMIIIYDEDGKIILTQKFSGKEAIVSSSDFINGIYFYQVSENNKSIASGKFNRE